MKLLNLLTTLAFIITTPLMSRTLTITETLDLARKNSEQLQIADNNKLSMEEKIREVKGSALPTIDTTISYTHYPVIPETVMRIPVPGVPPIVIPAKQNYEGSISTTLTQILWSFGKVTTAIELAQKSKEATELSKQMSEDELVYQVKIAYYTTLFAKDVSEIAESSYANAQKNRTLTKERYAYGKIPTGQEIKMNADVASRVATKEEAKAAYHKSLQYIKRLTGLTDESIALEKPTVKSIDSVALRDNDPRLMALDKKIAVTDDLIKINKASHYPILVGFANHTYNIDGKDPTIGRENEKNIAAIGIKLNIPIFHGGSTEATYQSSLLEKNSAILEKEKAKRDLNLQLENAYTDFSTAQITLSAATESLQLAERNYRLAQARYATGNAALTEVNDLELALTGQRISLAKSQLALLQATALIERLTKE